MENQKRPPPPPPPPPTLIKKQAHEKIKTTTAAEHKKEHNQLGNYDACICLLKKIIIIKKEISLVTQAHIQGQILQSKTELNYLAMSLLFEFI